MDDGYYDAWMENPMTKALKQSPQDTRPQAKQEQGEPVAWMQEGQPELYVKEEKDEKRGYVIPLYTHPQPKQESVDWNGSCVLGHCGSPSGCESSGCCRADSVKQEQDEPVSKPTEDMVLSLRGNSGLSTQDAYDALVDVLAVIPLYTHPQPVTTCSGCGESSTKDGFLATYCLKCCEMVSGKQTTHHWYDTGYDTGYMDASVKAHEEVVSGKPLTDEQIETLWYEDASCDMPDELKQFKHTVRAIEAAHGIKEKNT